MVYAIMYGKGAKTLGNDLGVSEEDADNLISEFKNTFSSIKRFLIKCMTDAGNNFINLKNYFNLLKNDLKKFLIR